MASVSAMAAGVRGSACTRSQRRRANIPAAVPTASKTTTAIHSAEPLPWSGSTPKIPSIQSCQTIVSSPRQIPTRKPPPQPKTPSRAYACPYHDTASSDASRHSSRVVSADPRGPWLARKSARVRAVETCVARGRDFPSRARNGLLCLPVLPPVAQIDQWTPIGPSWMNAGNGATGVLFHIATVPSDPGDGVRVLTDDRRVGVSGRWGHMVRCLQQPAIVRGRRPRGRRRRDALRGDR